MLEILEFLTVNSRACTMLQKFPAGCFVEERVPSTVEWTEAIREIVNW